MKVLFLGAEFMQPFWRPEIDEPVAVSLLDPLEAQIIPHRDAVFAYAMNTSGAENISRLHAARDLCKAIHVPTVWHTIEDPNSFEAFAPQAEGFDLIATSAEEKATLYVHRYPPARVMWLPLAAQPRLHTPAPTAEDAADLVIIANWYSNGARLAAVRAVVDPLLGAGMTLALFHYTSPAFMWPQKYRQWWRGATSCYDVAHYYPAGRIAIGLNNQAWDTTMCSMRTFEALACGRPFLSYYSDAYWRLGFVNEIEHPGQGHFAWTDSPDVAVRTARWLLDDPAAAAAMADRGRQFVLDRHTYAHRLRAILEALA